MKNIERLIFSVAIVALVIMVFFMKCGNGKYVAPEADTVKKITKTLVTIHDTIRLKQEPEYIEVPTEAEIIKVPVYVPDTSYAGLKSQYLSVMSKYLTKRYYNEPVPFFKVFIDSATGIKDTITGMIEKLDTIGENRILGSSLVYDLKFHRITEQQKITKTEPRKTMWFIGAEVLGNQTKYVNGLGANIGFLNKKNQFYEVGYDKWGSDNIYRIGAKLKVF